MNFYIYRDLTVGEKRAIALTIIFVLIATIAIFMTMPHPESDCLVIHGRTDLRTITIKTSCLEQVLASIAFAAQISHVLKGALLATASFSGIFCLVKFLLWVNRRPSS